MKTFDAESTLPRVPLPTLEQSGERFLQWCAPLLSEQERADTEQAVAAMLAPDSSARKLHSALQQYDQQPGVQSWLDDFWPTRYLGRRDRIALNANFVLSFARQYRSNQLQRAAELTAGAVALLQQIINETLPVAMLRGSPLSMEQFKSLFATTRIPAIGRDKVRRPWSDEHPGAPAARHIAVLRRGHIFMLDVIDGNGGPYGVEALLQGFASVCEQSEQAAAHPIGPLTTGAREQWAADRDQLLATPDNAAALEQMESALFCLCLDDVAPPDLCHSIDALLHGSCANRWFDKAVSLIVFADGEAGINIEHCGLDGTTVLTLIDFLHEFDLSDRPVSADIPAPATELLFALTDEQVARVDQAAAEFQAFANATASRAVEISDFGANRAKQLGSSPDAFAQMAYQLAHHRTRGFCGATYESVATRHFRVGRTEAMRVVTPESKAFAEAMANNDVDHADKAAALRRALAAHSARAKQCQQGDAPEQHLWELQLLQQRRAGDDSLAGELPLFDCPGWRLMRDDYLSTTSVPSVNVRGIGFGSTSSHCIGIGYVLLPNHLNLYLSAPRTIEHELEVFARELRRALVDMQALLEAHPA